MREKSFFKRLDRWLGVPLLWLGAGLARLAGGVPAPAPLGRSGRVLAVKFSALGDTLLLLPVLKALRGCVGAEGRVEMICTRVNAGALRGLPWLDAVHVIEPGRLLGRPWELWPLLRRLRAARFDWALDFDQWLRSSALLAAASGARGRAGFVTPGQFKHALFHAVASNHRAGHEFDQFKAVAALAGVAPSSVEAYHGFLLREGFLGAAPPARAEEPLVLFHPGAGGHRAWQREWPAENYAALGLALRKAAGVRIALSGGAEEAALCDAVETAMGPADERCVGQPLEALVALLCRAALVVCGNTGVMHLAAGLGRPLLALHGPTSPLKWGPRADSPGARVTVLAARLPCSPCLTLGFEYGCDDRPCMRSLHVESAVSAALGLLKGH